MNSLEVSEICDEGAKLGGSDRGVEFLHLDYGFLAFGCAARADVDGCTFGGEMEGGVEADAVGRT